MASLEKIQAIAESLGLLARLKIIDQELTEVWEPLWMPAPGYLETGRLGPYPERTIAWVDLLSDVTTSRGRLVAPLVENKLAALTAALAEAGLSYELQGGWVRVQLPNNSFKPKPLRGSA